MPITITVTPLAMTEGVAFNTHAIIVNPAPNTYLFVLTLKGRFVGDSTWTTLQTSTTLTVPGNSQVTHDFLPQITAGIGTAEIMATGTIVGTTTSLDSNIVTITITSVVVIPPPAKGTVAARSIGPLGVPACVLHQLWRLREHFIRPEVHKKLHPLV